MTAAAGEATAQERKRMRWSAAQALSWIICGEPREMNRWTHDMGPRIEHARETLARAIGSGQVQAWGRPQPHAELERLPDGQFRIPGLPAVVDPHGAMISRLPHKPYSGPKWESIEFDAKELEKAFPLPPSQTASDWMENEAKRLANQGSKGKQDDLVKRCMDSVGCSRDEARRAYRALPNDMKLRRGRPRKPSA